MLVEARTVDLIVQDEQRLREIGNCHLVDAISKRMVAAHGQDRKILFQQTDRCKRGRQHGRLESPDDTQVELPLLHPGDLRIARQFDQSEFDIGLVLTEQVKRTRDFQHERRRCH